MLSLNRNVLFLSIDEDGDIFVYSTDQSAHQTLHEVTLMLGTDKVKVQNALVGGGFGGKEDMTVQHLAALLTYATKKPVKMKLTRAESLLVHPKRHPFYMDMTMGCDENGNIMGVKAKSSIRYRGICFSWRSGTGTCLYTCGRSVSL